MQPSLTDATLIVMTTKYFCMSNSRRLTIKRALLSLPVMLVVCYVLHGFMKKEVVQELCTQTNFRLTPSSQNASAFIKLPDLPTYILSAIIAADEDPSTRPVVIVNAWDNSDEPLNCCILHSDGTLHVTRASILRQFHPKMFLHALIEIFYYTELPARQITCPLISPPQTASHLALTPSSCSKDGGQYKPIVHAKKHQGKLAVCAKVAYNDSLDPARLVEWMEFQKMMGVDKVLLFTLQLNLNVTRVLDFYVKQGFLTTVPFQLPGKPVRGFRNPDRVFPQFSHDEQMAIFDCRHRLSGYSHVAGIDLDEIILPRSGQTLKEFLQTTIPKQYPDAGAYYFYQQFHITDWQPSHPKHSLTTLRYLSSDPPRWECQKFIYKPKHTLYGRTHEVFVKSGFTTYVIPPEVAVIHHFRSCPATWKDCHTRTRIIDNSTLAYQGQLERRVSSVMTKLRNT